MSINITDELHAATTKGKIASAKEVFLTGDTENLQQIGEKTHQLEDSIKNIAATGGASTAAAVTFDNAASGMTAVNAQAAIEELSNKNKLLDTELSKKANTTDIISQMQTEQTRVNAELNKKFAKTDIVQELGESEEKVVSQKCIKDHIENIKTNAINLDDKIKNIDEKLFEINVDIYEKRYDSNSLEYKKGKQISTSSLKIGDTVSITGGNALNGVFILDVTYGCTYVSRTRYDGDSRLLIVDKDMKLLAFAGKESGIQTSVENTAISEKEARYLIISHRGTEEYEDSWIYATYKYEGLASVKNKIKLLDSDIYNTNEDIDDMSVYINKDNIFTIQGYCRDINNTLLPLRGFATTPYINVNTIRGWRNGIFIKEGSFRCPASDNYGVMNYYNKNKNIIGTLKDVNTFNKDFALNTYDAPEETVYITLNGYDSTFKNPPSVMLDAHGIPGIEEHLNSVDNALSIHESSIANRKYSTDCEYWFPKRRFSVEDIVVGNTIKEAAYNINIKAGYFKIPCTVGCLYKIMSRRDKSAPYFITDKSLKILYVEEIKSLLEETYVYKEITDSNAYWLFVPALESSDYPLSTNYVVKEGNGLILKHTKNYFNESFPNIKEGISYKNIEYTFKDNEVNITSISNHYGIYWSTSSYKEGHKIYIGEWMKSTSKNDALVLLGGIEEQSNLHRIKHSGSGRYEWLSGTINSSKNSKDNLLVFVYWLYVTDTNYGDRNISIKHPVVIDLTETFGKGKEPSTSEMDAILNQFDNNWFGGNNDIIVNKNVWEIQRKANTAYLANFSTKNKKDVVNPNMGIVDFIHAYNAEIVKYATFCSVGIDSMILLTNEMDLDTIYKTINMNFRDNVVFNGMDMDSLCIAVNNAFTKPYYRFCDAKPYLFKRDFSLGIGSAQSTEPSAIISDDGSTLYIYAWLKRFKTKDGVNWDEPEPLVLKGGPSYIMHNNTNYINGVYYLIGATTNDGGDLVMFTSTDGINFTYASKIWSSGSNISNTGNIVPIYWGNTYLIKQGDKWYLYVELSRGNGGIWETFVAVSNEAAGPYSIYDKPILDHQCGNPDIAKGMNNMPIKVNGYYFMYYHQSIDRYSCIRRAYSRDLISWIDDGFVSNNRDIPTDGEQSHGNADHCIIEFKGRSYLFYTLDINSSHPQYVKYTIDDRPLHELLKIFP